MKKQISMAIMSLLLLGLMIGSVLAVERTLFIDDYEVKYSYADAEEDERFTLTVEITNTGENKTEVLFELDQADPFDIESDDEWEIGDLAEDETVIETFRIDVDKNTAEGEYEIEFTLDDSDEDYTDEFEIDVSSDQADLIIGNIQTQPTILSPDQEDIKLDITIENIGSGDATFVRAKLILPNGFETSSSFSDFSNLGTIYGDSADEDNPGSKTATFFIDTKENLGSGVHTAELELEYKSDVQRKTQRLDIDLPVKGSALFDIVSSSTRPSTTMSGQTGKLTINIQNNGEEDGKETSIRVFENSDLPVEFDEKTDFIGNLKAGETGTAIFDFEIDSDADSKEYLVKVQVRTLNNDNIIVSDYSVPLKIEEGQGGSFIIPSTFLILTIILIVILIYVYRKTRKRK